MRFARLDAIGQRLRLDGVRHAVDEPAQQLPPEVLVRHVVDGDRRVHLPQPRVLQRERERLAAAVALEGQHRPFATRLVGAGQQRRSRPA